MSYECLRVLTCGKSDLCYIPKSTLHDKYDIYAPINKKYHNISLAIPHKHYKYIEPSNDTINEMFPDSIYLILDLELEPDELERQYKRLIADVAYKRFL